MDMSNTRNAWELYRRENKNWDVSHVELCVWVHVLLVRVSTVELQYKYFDGLLQKRRNSSALAMESHLFCIKQSICSSSS